MKRILGSYESAMDLQEHGKDKTVDLI